MGATAQWLWLGRVGYAEGLRLQKRLVEIRYAGQVGDVLLLLEHPPVLTVGRNKGREHVVAAPEELARRGVEIVETNRGGDVTYHGPGQLVGYPIVDLRATEPRLGVVDYVRRLEEVLIRVAGEYGVLAERVSGRTGVWTVRGGSILERKMAAIGVHVSRGITSHGFALNVSADLRDFGWIVPCGIADRGVANLGDEAGLDLELEKVGWEVVRQFGRVFGREMLAVDGLDALGIEG